MKFWNKERHNMLCLYILVIFVSLVACRQLFLPGYFPMHDDLQIGRLYQMDKCIKDLQIPCRWVPDMGYGYGYPLFNFYPPFPYYLGEVFHLLEFSFIDSVKILFILGFVLSGVFMFLLAKEFWGEVGGLISAAFYIFAPYHAVDVYVRGAMGEFWAITFFPAIFWAVAKLVKNRQKSYIAILALFYGLLLLSHNIMAMLFSPLVGAWVLFLVWYYKKLWRVIIPVIIGGIWGICLAAFFTLPAFFEKNFIHIKTMLMGYFNYLAHFVSLKQLFFSRFWGYGPSTWGENDGMPFQIGYLHWVIPTLSLILFSVLLVRKRINGRHYLLFTIYYLLFLGSAFLTHLRSTPIWQTIKPLEYLQFPWRFLAITIFTASFLSGSLIFAMERGIEGLCHPERFDCAQRRLREGSQRFFGLWPQNDRKSAGSFVIKWLTIVLIAVVIALNFNYFKPEKILKITDEEKLFSPKGWNKLQTDAIFDYLPIYAKQPPAEPAPEDPEVLEGKAGITYLKRGTDWLQFDAKIIDGPAKIRLPIYDYPGWKVFVDKKPVKIDHDNFLGLITFNVPPGDYQVSTRLTSTPVRTSSNFISLVSWIVLVLLIIQQIRQRNFPV